MVSFILCLVAVAFADYLFELGKLSFINIWVDAHAFVLYTFVYSVLVLSIPPRHSARASGPCPSTRGYVHCERRVPTCLEVEGMR